MNKIKKMIKVAFYLLVLAILAYAGVVLYVCYLEKNIAPASDFDAIIILGAQVKPEGVPSLQLEYRLDKAFELYTLHPCIIITCGAQGLNEPTSEAEFMREWLVQKGVPPECVLTDSASFNTRQNIQNAVILLDSLGAYRPIIITSDYHVPRAIALAADEGLSAAGAGSRCQNDIVNWSRNHLREALAWCKYWAEKALNIRIGV
jgi:uncharacterized SAM-binding protein YcdF (DUF218 family)